MNSASKGFVSNVAERIGDCSLNDDVFTAKVKKTIKEFSRTDNTWSTIIGQDNVTIQFGWEGRIMVMKELGTGVGKQ
jgi:hypothetical protein